MPRDAHITGNDRGDFPLQEVLRVGEDRLKHGQPSERPDEGPDPDHIIGCAGWCGIRGSVSKPPAQPSGPFLEYVAGHPGWKVWKVVGDLTSARGASSIHPVPLRFCTPASASATRRVNIHT